MYQLQPINLVKKCEFDGAFTFIFSARENTPASKMKDNLSLEEKNNRLQKLNKLINTYSKEYNLKILGTIQKVLVTSISEKDNNKVAGYTENMKLVNIDAPITTIGKIINVEINDAKSFSLDGVIKK